MADLLFLPIPERSCFNCTNATFGSAIGTFCPIFSETIFNEQAAAKDCPRYERDSEAA